MTASQKTHDEALSAVPDSDLQRGHDHLRKESVRCAVLAAIPIAAVGSVLVLLPKLYFSGFLHPAPESKGTDHNLPIGFILASVLCAFNLFHFGRRSWAAHKEATELNQGMKKQGINSNQP